MSQAHMWRKYGANMAQMDTNRWKLFTFYQLALLLVQVTLWRINHFFSIPQDEPEVAPEVAQKGAK